jgi:hypothetical protein
MGACSLGDGGVLDDCNVLACTEGTLRVGANGVIEECLSRDSTGAALVSTGPAVMEDNFVLNNPGAAITIDARGIVIGNRVYLAGGISVGDNSVVSENDVSDSLASVAIQIRGSNCCCEENHVSGGTTGVGVLSPASRVMVDGNQVAGGTGNGIVLQAGTSRCLVVRNAVSPPNGVAGYSLSPGNSWGPILAVAGVGDITGSGTATDAWTNFEY